MGLSFKTEIIINPSTETDIRKSEVQIASSADGWVADKVLQLQTKI